MSREQCIKDSNIDNKFTHPHLQNPSDQITDPEDANWSDLIPELSTSGGFET